MRDSCCFVGARGHPPTAPPDSNDIALPPPRFMAVHESRSHHRLPKGVGFLGVLVATVMFKIGANKIEKAAADLASTMEGKQKGSAKKVLDKLVKIHTTANRVAACMTASLLNQLACE